MTRSRSKVHPICKQLKDLRVAARLSLSEAEKLLGVSAVVIGSYERGDRMPSLARIDAVLHGYGYRVAAVPVDFDAIRLPSDIAAELRAIADQIEKESHHDDAPELPPSQALLL
jgi:transcriptional regulator with XRE-family HTH domain